MTRIRVAGFSVSLDGFGAGPDQSLNDPLGKRGTEVHEWLYPTRVFHEMIGEQGGSEGLDNDYARRARDGFGAHILGRNMYAPVRGEWATSDWRGWWGDNPPFHAPTFIVTSHAREPLVMEGGTVFHFVTGGVEAALAQAKAAAGDLDVKIGGGVSTIRQYLEKQLIDELHIVIAPVLLGRGEALFAGLDLPALGYHVVKSEPSDAVTHVIISR